MASALDSHLLDRFPRLRNSNHRVVSPKSENYNCVAFCLNDKKRQWWPNEYWGTWPEDCLNAETAAAFIQLFEGYGFASCDTGGFQRGVEKVAIFVKDGKVTHVALQRRDRGGRWVSKLGGSQDIEHDLAALERGDYGNAELFMRRTQGTRIKTKRRSRSVPWNR